MMSLGSIPTVETEHLQLVCTLMVGIYIPCKLKKEKQVSHGEICLKQHPGFTSISSCMCGTVDCFGDFNVPNGVWNMIEVHEYN